MNEEQQAQSLNIENATLRMELKIATIKQRGAQRQADSYNWRYRLWKTIAVTTWVALVAWRVWQYFD